MIFPESVRIVEVGPRDGLQNEQQLIPADTKVELVRRLAKSGLQNIEITSFVSPKWVPQLGDNSEVLAKVLSQKDPRVSYSVLTPNLKGYNAAIASGAKEVAVFGSVSETFSRKNINCSVDESIDRFRPIIDAAIAGGIKVRAYVSCVAGCPFEGEISPQRVAEMASILLDLGCYEISLGDTIGIGNPYSISRMLDTVLQRVSADKVAGHYHDTYGMAIANIYASLQMGVSVFDASIAGLGGCPYATRASGNVATEDVVWLLQTLSIKTGIDLDILVDTASWISAVLGRDLESHIGRALISQ